MVAPTGRETAAPTLSLRVERDKLESKVRIVVTQSACVRLLLAAALCPAIFMNTVSISAQSRSTIQTISEEYQYLVPPHSQHHHAEEPTLRPTASRILPAVTVNNNDATAQAGLKGHNDTGTKPQRPPSSTTTTTTTTTPNRTSTVPTMDRTLPNPNQEDPTTSNHKKKEFDVCFITAIYGRSADETDRPCNVTAIAEAWPTSFRSHFFLYTNLEDLDAPGFTKINNVNLTNYRRFITQSRWGKFMAWNHVGDRCHRIAYFDGMLGPTKNYTLLETKFLQPLEASIDKIVQVPQSRSIRKEFKSILKWNKDIETNVNASLAWFDQQPDYDDKILIYKNTYFGYDPDSPTWQAASASFWNQYATEDGSWRDQPLWGHMMKKSHAAPTKIPERVMRQVFPSCGRKAKHHYSVKDDNNAAKEEES